MLFLLNNIAKMKTTTKLGSRIAEVHNGSSIFTGDAGSGESNARRYIVENDLLEAVIAVPENMFYNTGIGTFIWLLSNNKEDRRKGKIQLIDATGMKSPLQKNLGSKNCEFTPEIRAEIMRVFMSMKESDISNDDYSREYAIDESRLLRFLNDTQKDELTKSRVLESEQKRRKFFARLNSEIARRGIADVLRKGIDFYLSSFVMFYLTPSAKNEKAKYLNGRNIFSVTNQLQFLRGKNDSVDM